MAKIDIRDDIKYPLAKVYSTFRDDLARTADYLPNIESIEVEKRERVDDDTMEIVNVWKASGTEVPKLASSFIKPEMLKWTDYATWHDGETYCEWKLVLGFLPDAVSCSGSTRYTAKGDKTQVHISGELKVDASKLGVPRLMSGKISKVVEEFVVKMVTPNLKATNRAVEEQLAAGE